MGAVIRAASRWPAAGWVSGGHDRVYISPPGPETSRLCQAHGCGGTRNSPMKHISFWVPQPGSTGAWAFVVS